LPEERGEKGSNKDVNKSSLLEGSLIIKVLGEEAREEGEEWDLVIRCEHCGKLVLKINSDTVRFRTDYKTRIGILCAILKRGGGEDSTLLFEYPIATYWCVLCADCYGTMEDKFKESSKLIHGVQILADENQWSLEKIGLRKRSWG